MSEVKTDKLSPRTASGTVTLGTSGDTFSIPSGVTLSNSGTASGFGDEAQYFFARMTGSNQSVSNNVATKVNINSEVLDNKSIFDTTNNKLVITAATAGIWKIGGQVQGFYGTNFYLQVVFALLYKNGSSLGDAYDSMHDVGGPYGLENHGRSVSAIVSLASGDYVELYGQVANASSAVGNLITQRGTNFYGHRIKAA